MSIVTWGWGSGAISTAGWGGGIRLVPKIYASYALSDAYRWVLTRDYVEVISRDKGDPVLRIKPSTLDQRDWASLFARVKGDLVNNDRTWSWDVLRRNYDEVMSREKLSGLSREKADSIGNRKWSDILNRAKGEIINRSKGWPWEE